MNKCDKIGVCDTVPGTAENGIKNPSEPEIDYVRNHKTRAKKANMNTAKEANENWAEKANVTGAKKANKLRAGANISENENWAEKANVTGAKKANK